MIVLFLKLDVNYIGNVLVDAKPRRPYIVGGEIAKEGQFPYVVCKLFRIYRKYRKKQCIRLED